MKQLNYKRAELRLSDHRPVSATFMAEVEIFSPRRLQKALTFTDAEIENTDVLTDIGTEAGITCLTLEQVNICFSEFSVCLRIITFIDLATKVTKIPFLVQGYSNWED